MAEKIFETLEYCKGIARFGVLIYDRSKRKTQTTKKQKRRNENVYTFLRLWRPGGHYYRFYN